MLVDDREHGAWNLTVFPLDDSGPPFTHSLPASYLHLVDTPVLGPDFLALGTRQQDENMALIALDLATRRSILPDGRPALRLDLSPPYRMQVIPPFIAVQSLDGVDILGDGERTSK